MLVRSASVWYLSHNPLLPLTSSEGWKLLSLPAPRQELQHFPRKGRSSAFLILPSNVLKRINSGQRSVDKRLGILFLHPAPTHRVGGSNLGQQAKNTGTLIALTPTASRLQVLQEAKETMGPSSAWHLPSKRAMESLTTEELNRPDYIKI